MRAVLIEELTILASWEFSSMIAVSSAAFISSLRRITFSQIRVSFEFFQHDTQFVNFCRSGFSVVGRK